MKTKEVAMKYLLFVAYAIIISLAVLELMDVALNRIPLLFLLTFSISIIYMSNIKQQLKFNLINIIELLLFVSIFLLFLLVRFDYSKLVFFVAAIINYFVFRRIRTSTTVTS